MKKLTVLSKIANTVTNVTGRTGLKISKMSPELLIIGGLIGGVGATFLACKATLKLEEVLDTAKVTVDKINVAKENKSILADGKEYSEKDASKDTYLTYVQTGTKIGKLYLPAATLGLLSVGCILYSFKILKGRNVALMAAYKCVESSFAKYRERLVADVGVEKDQEYRYGVRKEDITNIEIGKNGKEKEVTTSTNVIDNVDGSEYAVIFDDKCGAWVKSFDYNMTYLKCQQQHANDILNSRGHLFLNEVYDMLGAPQNKAGAVTGWVKGVGDSFVDFNIFDGAAAKLVGSDGYSKAILLDFNVDGVILDLI